MSPLRRHLPLLPIGALLVLHTLVYDFVCDDAFISFVYSRNLAEHGQLVFNLGDRVEGYTNFLWTVLLAGLMKLGVAPEIASRVLGTGFALGTLVVAFHLSAKLRGKQSIWDYLPPLLLAASSGFACWASGGLETQQFTFLIALGTYLLGSGRSAWGGAVFALSALTRPEGALVFAVVMLHWRISDGIQLRSLLPTRRELACACAFLAVFAPYWAWRWWYYGWFFPNTFYVKVGTTSPEYAAALHKHGLYYVWQWALQSKAIYALPFLVAGLIRHRRFGGFVLALTAAYLGYAVFVGGDFMGLHRFVMPLFFTTAMLASLGAAASFEWIPVEKLFAGLALAAVLALFVWSQHQLDEVSQVAVADNGIDRPGYLRQYAHDRGLLGKALAPLIRPDDFSFVGGVGVQPYYARMRAVDVFGLVSADVAHHVPPTNPRPGHQKWAPADLVLRYRPTFIFHCYSLHQQRDQYGLCGEASFFQGAGYEPVTLHVPGLLEGKAEYYTFLKRKDRAWP